MKDRNKIFYEMKSFARDEGFKDLNYQPILWPKIELSNFKANQIAHIAAQPYKKVFYCNEGYGLIKFKNDRFGFRNYDQVWNKIHSNKIKIMFVGDSFAQGACVHDKDTISNKIKDFNKNFITFNLGISGNNAIMDALTIKTFTKIIKPTYLIIIIAANDHEKWDTDNIFRSQIYKKDLDTRYFTKNNTSIYLSKEILDEIKIREKKFSDNIKIYYTAENKKNNKIIKYLTLVHIRDKINLIFSKHFFSMPNDTKILIDTANEECAVNKCVPIFTYVPSSVFWENDQLQVQYKSSIEKYLLTKNNIYADLNGIIESNNKDNYALKGGHLNPRSYEMVAKEIYKKIANMNVKK